MKLRHLLPALALAACAQFDTPEERYFATVGFVKATGEVVEAWVDACNAQAPDDPCRDKFPKIHAGAKAMKSAMAETDKVFVTKDSQFYDLSLTATQNATLALRNLIKD